MAKVAKKTAQTNVRDEVRKLIEARKMLTPEIDGFAFRWVSMANRNRLGWGIWVPVEKNTEIGDKVEKWAADQFRQFSGTNADSKLFLDGAGGALAYTTVERRDALRSINRENARAQLNAVQKQEKSNDENTDIRLSERTVRVPDGERVHTGEAKG